MKVYAVYTYWQSHGYLASCPDLGLRTETHHAGPRTAADTLASTIAGGRGHQVRFRRRGEYAVMVDEAHAKDAKGEQTERTKQTCPPSPLATARPAGRAA